MTSNADGRERAAAHAGKRALAAAALCLVLLNACDLRGAADVSSSEVEFGRGTAVRAWDGGQRLARVDAGDPRGVEQSGGIALLDAGDAHGPPARVVFRVTTVSQAGRYQPKNIGAIWVEDGAGDWVKTLALWAGVRVRYLVAYNAANPTHDTTDAVTSATLRQHEMHEVIWDLTDAGGDPVPDGTYSVHVEATDRDARGQLTSVEFEKSPVRITVTPEDTAAFTDLELSYE